MSAEAGAAAVRERLSARVRRGLAVAWAFPAVLAALLALGVGFAGSPDTIAAGVTVEGVDVGGMTPDAAERTLARRAAAAASVPVVFGYGDERRPVRPIEIGVRADWEAAAAEARAAGDWPLPFRGLKRLAIRLFGTEVTPRAEVDERALERLLGGLAKEVDRPARSASIVLRGLAPVIVPERAGRKLDRASARATVVAALVGFARDPVRLPVGVDPPSVTRDQLVPVAARVETALSAPVRFGWNDVHWLVRPPQLAELLELPAGGSTELRIGGPEATRYFNRLARAVNRTPRDAGFAIAGTSTVRVVPAVRGRALDVRATAAELLAAALSPRARNAELVVRALEPELTTARARAMGVSRVLSSYSTYYAGSADRIHNLQRAVALLDGTRIAPGATFSFNETVGPRTAERGFRLAPVIIEGKYEDGIGGGVSQVATTVFNAAWEAGLKITSRTAHALYISRYPLGRDATVNYPDIDLTFVNDTKRWLVLKGGYGETGIAVTILGGPTGRRVVSRAGPLEETGPPEVERVPDPTLFVGERIVEQEGEPPRTVTVWRTVYVGDEVLYDETWRSIYQSEPRIVRVGTKPLPVEEKPAEPAPQEDDAPKEEGDVAPPTATTPTTTTSITTTTATTTD